MMILLSQKEYDKLIAQATAVDLQVEQRLEAEKARLYTALRKAVTSEAFDTYSYKQHPALAMRDAIHAILGSI